MVLRHRCASRAAAVVVAAGALALVACGSSGSTSSSGPTIAQAGLPPVLTSTGQPVPKPLDELEAQSEDLIDIVPGGKWDQVAGDVTSIDTARSLLASERVMVDLFLTLSGYMHVMHRG